MGNLFARLGPLKFEFYTAPTRWCETAGNTLIEHKTVEGKPRLEWVGEELRRITLEVKLHRLYCDPEAILATLAQMRRTRKAWPLTRGDGQQDGEWVLQSIERRTEQCDSEGLPLFLTLSLGLIESPTPLGFTASGLKSLVKTGLANAPRAFAPGQRRNDLLPAPGLVSLLRILR